MGDPLLQGSQEVLATLGGVEGAEAELDMLVERMLSLESALYGPESILEAPNFVAMFSTPQSVVGGPETFLESVKRNSDAVVALVLKENLHLENGQWILSGPMTQVPFELCPEERFYNHLAAANDTGVLVGGRTILTASHCIRDDAELADLYFVFGFEVQPDGVDRKVFPPENVFDGALAKITKESPTSGEDWALIELDRDVGLEPVQVRTVGQIADNQAVYVLGHPLGMSRKADGSASVRDNSSPRDFEAQLDVYERSSGSPVYNASDHTLEGIVQMGDSPLFPLARRPCNRTRRCRGRHCRGERVLRITRVTGTPEFQNRK